MRFAVMFMAYSLLVVLVITGCNTGTNPVIPGKQNDNGFTSQSVSSSSQTHLWGYYDVYIDIPTKSVSAVLNRSAMFAANVVTFINSKPANLGFNIIETPTGADYVDVDIDVSITHPFPGLNQYDGYDVRGIFIGDGSAIMNYNNVLNYALLGSDQYMLNDPDSGDGGGPDGYTRWFNPTEFLNPGLFGYTPGKYATPKYNGLATLNPYKYFADGLGAKDDIWTWLNANANKRGIFTAGAKNTRNYYLRFPNSKGVKYNYAIVANWEGETIHPSNALESVAVSVNVTPDLYYVNPTNKGGKLILDISVFNWSSVMMEQQQLFVESTVLTSTYKLTSGEMVPTGGTGQYSTYHVEIPADNIKGTQGNEFWIIAENPNANYKNNFGVTNGAGEDPLAAFFRFDLYVSPTPYCPNPVVNSIDPNTSLSGAMLNDVSIFGTNLVNGPSLAVKLMKAGQADIVGTDIKHVTNTLITADFNLTGAADGYWDVFVTNGCGKSGTGTGLFQVTSCTSMNGFTTNYYAVIMGGYPNDMPSYVSGVCGTQTGTPYAISVANRDGYNKLGAVLVSADSGNLQYISDGTGVGSMDRDMVCDSQNRVYFTDATNYSRLRYCQFNAASGFGPVTEFSILPTGWSIRRITIDESDNPVVLANDAAGNMRVYHWNSVASNWDFTVVPSSVVQGSITDVGDFDYNPMLKHYVILRRMSTTQVNLYAIDKSGNLAVTVPDLFQGVTSTALPGIYIDVKSPTCRIVAWGGHTSFTTLPTPFVRMNAVYGQRVNTTLIASNFSNGAVTGGRGQEAKGSNRLVLSAHYINVYGKVPLPAGW